MARKNKRELDDGISRVYVTLDLPKELESTLRIVSIMSGMSISDYIVGLLRNNLADKQKKVSELRKMMERKD
ncbi:MAG: hypothetical protein IJ504_01070 [Bacteroidales bacterium]|nr:hypothetical protein [Bacteroidales bacterium]